MSWKDHSPEYFTTTTYSYKDVFALEILSKEKREMLMFTCRILSLSYRKTMICVTFLPVIMQSFLPSTSAFLP